MVTATLRELNFLISMKKYAVVKPFFRTFSGANSKRIYHYIIPTLVDDKRDVVLLHVDTNDILSNANDTELAINIINIGFNCKNHGLSKVLISSTLVKKNPKLNPVIRRVNDQLRELCEINDFLFISNDMITTDHLWRYGTHLQDIGTNVLSRRFTRF